MHYAYDLDGTLADTRRAVVEAYRAVGVEPPENFFGKPWREWLTDSALHDRKNAIYPQYVRKYVRPTHLVDTFKATGGLIITGASNEAARIVLDSIGLEDAIMVFSELSMQGKANLLNGLSEEGVVFEDSEIISAYLKENTKWTVCRVL